MINNAFNNTSFKDSLQVEENRYMDSGTATSNKREFKVGYCVESFNGQRVFQLHQRRLILNKIIPFREIHVFEGDIPNVTIIGWEINCTRSAMDDLGGSWKRCCKVLGTNHFKFLVTSCFMRNLEWEIKIYYI